MEEFPGNPRSRREAARPEPKKPRVERIIHTEVTQRKKGRVRKVVEMFIGGEPKSVGEFVLGNVLVPAFRDLVANGFQEMIDGMVYGESRHGRGNRYRPSPGLTPHTPYHRMASSRLVGRPDPREPLPSRASGISEYEDIVFPMKVQAVEVLDRLFALIQEYEAATVRDLYDMVGIKAPYTAENYGWVDIRDADVRPVRGGFLLDLPRPEPLR